MIVECPQCGKVCECDGAIPVGEKLECPYCGNSFSCDGQNSLVTAGSSSEIPGWRQTVNQSSKEARSHCGAIFAGIGLKWYWMVAIVAVLLSLVGIVILIFHKGDVASNGCETGASVEQGTVEVIEKWNYKIENGGVVLGGADAEGTCPAIPGSVEGRLEIPSEIDGYPVRSIENGAFSGCIGLTSVTIPSGVKKIAGSAFSGCIRLANFSVDEDNLWYTTNNGLLMSKDGRRLVAVPGGVTNVTLSSRVKHIQQGALSACGGLMCFSVDEDNAHFMTMNGLLLSKDGKTLEAVPRGRTSVTIPDSVTRIGYHAFDGCEGLKSVTIPDGVTKIDGYAFSGCAGLTSVTIPSGVRSIGDRAFSGCAGLTSLFVDECNLRYMSRNGLLLSKDGKMLVAVPGGLTRVTIPSGVTRIGDSAFSGCAALTSITIPDGVRSIGDWAFSGCAALTSITIPEGVSSIGGWAFSGCSGLASVTIPSTVMSIGSAYASVFSETSVSSVFSGCAGLMRFVVDGANEWYMERNGLLLSKNGRILVAVPNGLTHVTIPYSVTYIAKGALRGCSALRSVTIPDGVTYIEGYAFYGCAGLASVTIPDSVTKIEDHAFSGCSGLTSVTIPDGVTEIESHAFSGCSGLTSVTIPDGVTEIESHAFSGCSGLTSITIPGSVMRIGGYPPADAFSGCTGLMRFIVDFRNKHYISRNGLLLSKDDHSLVAVPGGQTHVTIPDGVTSVWPAFSSCPRLTSVTMPSTLTLIGNGAFKGCDGLRSVTIPDSVTRIVGGAFEGCCGLTSVTIPGSLTNIEDSTFAGCTRLESVTIPDSVTTIGRSAFKGCRRLASVTIPGSVKSIGEGAFSGCTGLTRFIVDAGNKHYTTRNGLLLSKDGKELVAVPVDQASVTIPNGVTKILGRAFSGCTKLTSVSIPSGVTVIDDRAFDKCCRLAEVTIPSSVTNIGEWAFAGCESLVGVTMPDSVTRIGEWAFAGCERLTSVAIPRGVACIEEGAFADCCNLTSVTIPGSVISIGRNAFSDCTGLTSVTMPAGVRSIGARAFSGCTGLTSVVIPESVASIEDSAFSGCTGLTSVKISGSVKSVDDGAFAGCYGLTSVNIPDSVTSIGSSAFKGCSGLTDVKIPGGVTSIGNSAFEGCSGLTSVTMLNRCDPDSLGSDVFSECYSLKTAFVPRGLTRSKSEFNRLAFPENCEVVEKDVASQPDKTLGGKYKFSYAIDRNGNAILRGKPCVSPNPVGELIVPDKVDGRKVVATNWDAFRGCDKLTKITLPETLKDMGGSPFIGATSLDCIEVPETHPYFVTIDGALYTKDRKELQDYPKTRDSINIAPGVSVIRNDVFASCQFTEAKLPEGITYVGDYAFVCCKNLEVVEFPKSLGVVGFSLFADSPKLKRIVFHGDAPRCLRNPIHGAPPDAVIYVRKGSRGWSGQGGTSLPERWPTSGESRPIRYMDGSDQSVAIGAESNIKKTVSIPFTADELREFSKKKPSEQIANKLYSASKKIADNIELRELCLRAVASCAITLGKYEIYETRIKGELRNAVEFEEKLKDACPRCSGSGRQQNRCLDCRGTGRCVKCNGSGSIVSAGFNRSNTRVGCNKCGGSGGCGKCNRSGHSERKCGNCGGGGRVVSRKKVLEMYTNSCLALADALD